MASGELPIYNIAKNVIQMEAVPRTQTAFRLKNSLLERLKWNTGRGVVFPKLPPEFFE